MKPVIFIDDVSKIYQSGDVEVHAVRDVSLTINPGEFVAIMGSSGSGKSTMMNVLGCLDRPTKGRYLLDDVDVTVLGRDARADIRNQKIGFIFQGFNLLSRTTAIENVELPMMYSKVRLTPKELRDKAIYALELVGLGTRAGHHPNQLSGGQQQRVAIARALVNDPALLLADEPTGNLDSRTSVEIMDAFQALNEKGITIVMVTHEPDIAQYTRRNVVMRDGVIVKDAPVINRTLARAEMQRLDAEHQAAQLVK